MHKTNERYCLHRQQLFHTVELVLKWVRDGETSQLANPTKKVGKLSVYWIHLFSGNWNIFLGPRGLGSKGRTTVTLQVSQLILLPSKSALYILIYGRNSLVRKRKLEVNLCFNSINKKPLHKPFQSHGLNRTSCTCGHHANKTLSLKRSNFFVGQKSG